MIQMIAYNNFFFFGCAAVRSNDWQIINSSSVTAQACSVIISTVLWKTSPWKSIVREIFVVHTGFKIIFQQKNWKSMSFRLNSHDCLIPSSSCVCYGMFAISHFHFVGFRNVQFIIFFQFVTHLWHQNYLRLY